MLLCVRVRVRSPFSLTQFLKNLLQLIRLFDSPALGACIVCVRTQHSWNMCRNQWPAIWTMAFVIGLAVVYCSVCNFHVNAYFFALRFDPTQFIRLHNNPEPGFTSSLRGADIFIDNFIFICTCVRVPVYVYVVWDAIHFILHIECLLSAHGPCS